MLGSSSGVMIWKGDAAQRSLRGRDKVQEVLTRLGFKK